jgi:putative membrane protein
VKKTLILVVDRDNDFGMKGGVQTPAIGIEAALRASMSLGVSDPEDSDVNTLFAAINIYNDLEKDRNVEIALICGDQRVGPRSDAAIVDELEEVIEKVRPDRAILVGDGAEDEYVYPIVSSRIPIDSVRRVYVKQSPGLEGSFYIVSKMIRDPQKRRRFLAPIGYFISLIAMIYLAVPLYRIYVGDQIFLYDLTTPIAGLVVGVTILLYAYSMVDRLLDKVGNWTARISSGNIAATFSLLSVSMFLIGIFLGANSIKSIVDNNLVYLILIFVSNAMWPIVFGVFLADLGVILNDYINEKKVSRSFMIGTITVFGLALIIQGVLDFMRNYLGYGAVDDVVVIIEITLGLFFTIVASLLQVSFRNLPGAVAEEEETAENAAR